VSRYPRGPRVASLNTEAARIGRTVRTELLGVAMVANAALLDVCPARFGIFDVADTGTYTAGYTPNEQARFLRIVAAVSQVQSGWASVSATITCTVHDDAGNSVGPSDDRIPDGFKSPYNVHRPTALVAPTRFDGELLVVGYLDLDALRADLTGDTWHLTFDVTLFGAGALVNRLEGWEVPRGAIDDATASGGVPLAPFNPDQPVSDGPLTSPASRLARIVETNQHARTTNRTYVALAWWESTSTSDTPSVTSTSDAPITLLDESGARAQIKVQTRAIAAGSAAGEPVRWRVRYRMTGGAGTEKLIATLRSSATGSPWSTPALAYSASFVWSAWVTSAIATSAAEDKLEPSAHLTASGPTAFISAIEIEERVV